MAYGVTSAIKGAGSVADDVANSADDVAKNVLDKVDDVADTLTDSLKSTIKKLDNVIENNLKDSDFSGTLRDLRGDPVPNGNGGFFDHKTEMQNSYKALQKTKTSLEGSLKNPNLSSVDRGILQQNLDKTLNYIKKIEELFKHFGGI